MSRPVYLTENIGRNELPPSRQARTYVCTLVKDSAVTVAAETPVEAKPKKPSTAHLKVVPETRALRDSIRAQARDFAQKLDRSRPLTKPEAQKLAEDFLRQHSLGEQYLGFALVAVMNEFWREQVAAIPFH